MQLAMTGSKSYAFLPSGILIVDPDPSLLAARSQLLKAAEHYVAACSEEAVRAELCSMEIKVAILSQTLERALLETLAQEIRIYWPNAYILLFGNMEVTLEERLYDDSIDVHCRPEELLSILHLLQKDAWKRTDSSPVRIGSLPFGLSGARQMVLHSVPPESDPSKQETPASEEEPTGRDVPADEHSRLEVTSGTSVIAT